MRLNCGPSAEEILQRISDWLKARTAAKINRRVIGFEWFAWYPVRVGPRECRWLETVVAYGRREECLGCLFVNYVWSWTYTTLPANPAWND